MSRNKVRSRVDEPVSLERELTRLEEIVPNLKQKDNQMVSRSFETNDDVFLLVHFRG